MVAYQGNLFHPQAEDNKGCHIVNYCDDVVRAVNYFEVGVVPGRRVGAEEDSMEDSL